MAAREDREIINPILMKDRELYKLLEKHIEKIKNIDNFKGITKPDKEEDIDLWLENVSKLFDDENKKNWLIFQATLQSIDENQLEIIKAYHDWIEKRVQQLARKTAPSDRVEPAPSLPPPAPPSHEPDEIGAVKQRQPATAPVTAIEPLKPESAGINSDQSVRISLFEAFKSTIKGVESESTFSVKPQPDSNTIHLIPAGKDTPKDPVIITRDTKNENKVTTTFPNKEAADKTIKDVLQSYKDNGFSPVEIKGSNSEIVKLMCESVLKVEGLTFKLSEIAERTLKAAEGGPEIFRKMEEAKANNLPKLKQ